MDERFFSVAQINIKQFQDYYDEYDDIYIFS